MSMLSFPLILTVITCIFPAHNIALALPPSRPLTTLLDIPTDHLVNLTAKSNVHCTTDATWKSPSFHDPRKYLHSCKEAARLARKDLWFDGHYELEEKYEFLDQHSTPQTTGPQIRLPKIYTATSSPLLYPSCTIAIAMIGSLGPGPALPGEPAGSFGKSDAMSLRQLLGSTFEPYAECIRRGIDTPGQFDPALGWSQAGILENVGVFYMGAGSVMDRRIPRAYDVRLRIDF